MRHSGQLVPRHAGRRRDVEAVDAAEQTMQLVAIEIADELRRIEQRPRPARRGALDPGQRLPATFRIRTRSRSQRHGPAAAPAVRRRQRHRASPVRSRSPPAETRSACCRPCPSRRRAQEPAVSAFPPSTATDTIDESRAPPPGWRARSPCRPTSCAISDRSSPSPASAVPAATFDINASRKGRRSMPRNAMVVSLANPIRSAQG